MPNIDRDDKNATRYEIPKPDIDEQIEYVKGSEDGFWELTTAKPVVAAILATLEDHKRITEAVSEQILQNQLAECQKECEEQARLNGMGSEREARLMAQLAELREKHQRLVARLREPTKEMMEAARGHLTTHGIFTSMSTVALRDSEGGE